MKRVLFIFLLVVSALERVLAQDSLAGRWEGTLTQDSSQIRLVLDITKASDGLLLGTITNLDHRARLTIDLIEARGTSLSLRVNAVQASYEGLLSADGNRITGTWTQGASAALDFKRVPNGADLPPAGEAPATPDLFGMPIEMRVPVPPTPFQSGGKTHLAYELHITNFGSTELLIQRLELLIGGSSVAAFEGTELNMMIERPGAPAVVDRRAVGAGQRAIAYMWISADAGTRLPATLEHRVTARMTSVTGGTVAISSVPPVVLGPPLGGSNWVALNGPDNASGHRRALLPWNGTTAIGQRFAIDWLVSGSDGKTFDGNPNDVRSYRAYGRDLLAVADGVVVSVRDGIPDNAPGASRAVPMGPETIAGNVIVLDVGGDRFAFYGHVQRGTLRVKTGDKVRRGQVIGLVGNSGNSDEPHLHFHVADSPSMFEAEGLPFVIDRFETLAPPSGWRPVQRELPLQGAIVRFPETR